MWPFLILSVSIASLAIVFALNQRVMTEFADASGEVKAGGNPTHPPHKAFDCAAGNRHALPNYLTLNLVGTTNLHVRLPDPLDLRRQLCAWLRARLMQARIALSGCVLPVTRSGDPQYPANFKIVVA